MYFLVFDSKIPETNPIGNIPIWIHFTVGTSSDSILELMDFGVFASNGSMFYGEVESEIPTKRKATRRNPKTPYVSYTQEDKTIHMEARGDLKHVTTSFIHWLQNVRRVICQSDQGRFQIYTDQVLEWIHFRSWVNRYMTDNPNMFCLNIVAILDLIQDATGNAHSSISDYLGCHDFKHGKLSLMRAWQLYLATAKLL